VRYLVISDIHANLPALEAVLADAPPYDAVWCLGDLVGYGPDPNECIERVRELSCTCLAGNHDWAALGRLNLNGFNPHARRASAWTQDVLSPESRDYLSDLPPRAELDGVTVAHASPREPIWEYVLDTHVALENFDHFSTRLCLVGHSHVPLRFVLDHDRQRCSVTVAEEGHQVVLDARRVILNPGSVGQPRDGDPRASFAILDTDAGTWKLHRVAYPIKTVQKRMRRRKLPRRLIARLTYGY
jgi:diadenosine tetraphosphatase ApaH/serine/threonine PP2A family protein phosphatase